MLRFTMLCLFTTSLFAVDYSAQIKADLLAKKNRYNSYATQDVKTTPKKSKSLKSKYNKYKDDYKDYKNKIDKIKDNKLFKKIF